MKKLSIMLVLALAVGFAFVSCDDGSTGGGGGADSIRIVSVTPSTNLTNGVNTQFTVVVDYVLNTQAQGRILISFNNLETPERGTIASDRSVSRGSGRQTFNVSAVTKNWFSQSDFRVSASLYPPYNSSGSNIALVTDRKVLTFR